MIIRRHNIFFNTWTFNCVNIWNHLQYTGVSKNSKYMNTIQMYAFVVKSMLEVTVEVEKLPSVPP